MQKARNNVACWDDVFMAICLLMAQRSKDPNTQVGACLVDNYNRLIGTGYNGFPRGIDCLPWDRDGAYDNTKYAYIIHAEENAIDNCDKHRLKDSTLYVTLYPCNKCAAKIIQNQITQVVYLNDQYHDKPEWKAARKLFKLAKIKVRKFIPKQSKFKLNLGGEKNAK